MIEALLLTGMLLQTHPCDITPTPKSSRQGTITTQFCANLKDEDGVTVAYTKVEVLVDNVVAHTLPTPQPTGTASASGYFLFEVPNVPISGRGIHNIKHRVFTLDGSAISDTGISHTIVNGPPMKPHGDRVK